MWQAANVLVWSARRKHEPSLEHGPPVLATGSSGRLSKRVSALISPGRLRHFARRKPPLALAGVPFTPERPPLAVVFDFSVLKPRLAGLFWPFLSVTYKGVARGVSGNVEKGFAKAGQSDCNLLILLGMAIMANVVPDDNFNDSFYFPDFPE